MYKDKRFLAIIPARGGSKGIPRKNIMPLCGKPLIAYTIEAARASKYLDRVVVSTDCDEIASVAMSYGSDIIKRPPELATDTAPAMLSVMHVIQNINEAFDAVVLLQPTSPLRTAEHIDQAVSLYLETRQDVCSVSPVADHPVLIRELTDDCTLAHLMQTSSTVRRQDMKAYFRVNGAIYINDICRLDAHTSMNDNPVGYLMPWECSVDIDEEKDIVMTEWLMQKPM